MDQVDEWLARLSEVIKTPQDAARIVDAVVARAIAPYHESITWGDRLMTLDKSVGWRSDPKFAAAFKRLSTSTGQTQYKAPDGIAWRLNTLVWAARNAMWLDGDFVECGVFEGEMSWLVTQVVDVSKRRFCLYDTFDGFSPKYSSIETDMPDHPALFELHDKVYRDPSLHPRVVKLFADQPNVEVIKGVVPDSLHGTAPERIAYLHIDMNSPGPEIGALDFLWDRVIPGAAIVLDDYGWNVFRAQKDAADSWFAGQGLDVLELPTGQGLVIKR